jgi:nucleoside 2-deoxyribosyltransferase
MKKCFIVCPIGQSDSETRRRSDKLLKHVLTPVCSTCGFEPIRVDNLNSSDSITETIINHLHDSDLVIADLTDHNPNAFFEIGYRSALKKPIIHLKSKSDSIPFDVNTIRTFDYDLTDLDSVEELKSRLIQTINSFSFEETSSIPNEPSSEVFNSQILQELFKIQDSIKQLRTDISSKDTSAISVLADKLANHTSRSPEEKLMELIIPTLLNDPTKLTSLMELGEKFSNSK